MIVQHRSKSLDKTPYSSYTKPTMPTPEFTKWEKEIADFWQKNKVFEKSVENRPVDKPYVFYDGPPFATGLPHYGHLLASTIKDIVPRYQTMRGFRVRRRWGWDCHGLPIENIVEGKLGVNGKKEIEIMQHVRRAS